MSRRLGGDYHTAEDVVQEAFTRAVKFLPSYDPDVGPFHSWFNVILYNSLNDVRNSNRVVSEPLKEEIVVTDIFNTNKFQNEDFRKYLSSTISGVPNKKHREILRLFYIIGYSSKEIPNLVADTTQSNVTTIVQRFRKQLEEA